MADPSIDARTAYVAGDIFSFGPFHLNPARRVLTRDGQSVALGGRSFEILCLLVERAGHVVSKEDILARVWPGIATVEGNLRVQISGLRKSLGEGQDGTRYILNVSNRGYSFIEPITHAQKLESPAASLTSGKETVCIPTVQGRVIGRSQATSALIDLLLGHRMVTLVGPGGVGKTTLALSTVPRLLTREEAAQWQGAHFVDLARLSDASLVASTVASALGVDSLSGDPMQGIQHYLRNQELLLLIDNCEHLAREVVQICEAILRGAPNVRILATSREALRIEGERIHTVGPLPIPSSDSLSAAQAITYPAVELFVERACARVASFVLRDTEAASVIRVCRRLDGIPLAIEMASARLDCLGLRGLAQALDEMFSVLTRGRRTALPRHQTLYAAIDWSHNLLCARDRAVFRRLSIFPGAFTIEAALAVAAGSDYSAHDILESLCDLTDRSLVASDVTQSEALFRLLETTRAYARAQLSDQAEAALVARQHARYCESILETAELARARNDSAAWHQQYGWLIDDIRSALDWAFAPGGDNHVGLTLTLAALPLWFHQSLMAECGVRIGQALAVLDTSGEPRDQRAYAKLHTALACVLSATPGQGEEARSAWRAAYDISEGLGDTDYMLRNLWGLWANKMIVANFASAHAVAEQFFHLASKSIDPSDRAVGHRLLAASLHFLGEQDPALHHVQQMQKLYRAPLRRLHIARYQFDQLVTVNIARARALWIVGRADDALRALDDCVEEALAIGHNLSLCNVLMQAACPVALLAGDLGRAERFTELLRKESERSSLDVWHLFAGCFQGQILVKEGSVAEGLPLIRKAIENQQSAGHLQYFVPFHMAYAEGLALDNSDPEALAVLHTAWMRAVSNSENWAIPELLRQRGDLLLRSGGPDAFAEGETLLLQSLELAEKGAALAWQLRTATSLATLWAGKGRRSEARNILSSVSQRFTQGFGLPDLAHARAKLAELDI